MKVSAAEIEQRIEHFRTTLKESGMKLTHQRLEIFREIAGSCEHPDADTVFKGVRERVPNVSLDTVYRTLWMLTDRGLLQTLGCHRGRAQFDANTKKHHHFICTKCGVAHDFYSDEFNELPVPDDVRRMGAVEDTHVEVRGICADCQKNNSGE